MRALAEANAEGADLVVFPELFLVGYPPEDLVLKPALPGRLPARGGDAGRRHRRWRPGVLVGTPWPGERQAPQRRAPARRRQDRRTSRFKHELPNYGVFDEKRVFAPGPLPEPVEFRGRARSGCRSARTSGSPDVAETWRSRAPSCCSCRTARPSRSTSSTSACSSRVARVAESGLPLVYVNQVGGQDELVFDGGSFVVTPTARWRHAACRSGEERIALTRWERGDGRLALRRGDRMVERPERLEAIYQRDGARPARLRATRTASRGVVLGLSGGIDSALTAAVAVDALGPDRVRGVHAAVALHQPRRAWTTPRSAPRLLGHAPRHHPDRAGGRGRSSAMLAAAVRRPRARRHRREHAGARPRRAADGALQQVRRCC